jgi:hypothetical protein
VLAWTPSGLLQWGGWGRKSAYKLIFELFEPIFTDHPRLHRIEKYLKNNSNILFKNSKCKAIPVTGRGVL